MLKVYTVVLLFMVLLCVTSSFTYIFIITVVTGILFAIFNDFHGNISVLDHFGQKTKKFLWNILYKSVSPTGKFSVTYKDSYWDMDKFNKSPSGSFYNWTEKSECFSPIYTSRLLPKYRTFAKATSTPLNSPRATPPPPERQRYSFLKNHQAKSDNNYEASPKSASKTWSNLNLSTYADSRSYGLASRIVDYNAREEERDNRAMYKSQRAFPIVRLFKKELPVISAKPNTVTVHIAQPDSANYEAEQRKLILQSIMQEKQQPQPAENTETRSVLDALKEISRKRIHPDDELNIMQNGTNLSKKPDDNFNYSNNSKRTKEDLSSQEKNDVSKNSSEKKINDPIIPYVDPITASLTSSDKAFERELLGKKRKAKSDSYETHKSTKVLKLHSVETQTTNDLLPQQPDFQTPKDVEMEESKENSPESATKQQNTPLKVFDDKPLEINRKKRLALILGALSGQAPDFGSPSETHSILSPANKSKQEKHVTFNETVEIRKIVSDDDLSASKSQQKTPFSESTHTSISTFTSLNAPTTSSTVISASNQVTTNSTFSLPNPLLSSTANSLQKQSQQQQQDNSKLEIVPQTKSSTEVAKPPSSKPGGFKFDLKAPTSQPQTNFLSPVVSSSSDLPVLQFKGPVNVMVSNSPSIPSTLPAPTFQFSGTAFGSTASTTPPKPTIADKVETSKNYTPPKSEAELNFNFQAGGTQKLGTASTSNIPPVTFTPPLTTKSVQFGTTNTTPSVVSPFGRTSFGKSSSPFEKTVTSSTPASSFKSNDAPTVSSLPFALPTTLTAPTQTSGFGATSSATISPFGTLTTTTTKSTPTFNSFTTQSSIIPGATSAPPSFGFVSSTSAPASATSANPGTFSFGGGSSASNFGTDKTSSFSFVGGTTTTSINTNTSNSIAPPAFGKTSTAPNIFRNTLSSSSPFKNPTGAVGFGNVTTPTTTSSFGTPAVTTSSAFGAPAVTTSSAFSSNTFGTSFISGSKFSQPAFGSSNPTTTFNSNTQSLPTFGTNTTSAFTPSTTKSSVFNSSSTFGANTSFGANSQPTSAPFGSNTQAFGSSTTQPAASSVFGSTFGAAPTAFGSAAPQTSAPTAFGSAAPQTSAPTAFGSAAPQTSAPTAFGSAAPQTSAPTAFGSAAPQTSAPTAFGSAAPQTSAPTFGNSSATPSFGSGTFGASTFGANTTQAGFGSSTSTGFGSTNTQAAFGSTPQSAFGTTGTQPSFGSTTQPAFGSSSQSTFGASTTQATTGFGTNTQQQQPFGSAPQTSFGSSQPPAGFGSPSTQSGFDGTVPPPPFGSSTQSAFGATTQPQPFSFGGGGGAAGVAAAGPSSGVFSFGSTNDPNKPVPNFSAGSNFGTPQQPFNVPNFNAPAPGMFSIGSGGSNTAKARSGRSRRRV